MLATRKNTQENGKTFRSLVWVSVTGHLRIRQGMIRGLGNNLFGVLKVTYFAVACGFD